MLKIHWKFSSLGFEPQVNGCLSQKGSNISEEDFAKERYILESAYDQIKSSDNGIVSIDYWNVAVAYARMGVDKNEILDLFKKAKEMDEEFFYKMIEHLNIPSESHMRTYLGDKFNDIIDLKGQSFIKPKNKDFRTRLKTPDRNVGVPELLEKLTEMMIKDQKYRYDSKMYSQYTEEQHILDQENASE